jgi:hypothetical protein
VLGGDVQHRLHLIGTPPGLQELALGAMLAPQDPAKLGHLMASPGLMRAL